MARLTVVVPCYNEADRLDAGALGAFVDGHPDAALLLVDDGSTDATGTVLEGLAAERPGRMQALRLTPNRGKAEAVREGMRTALAAGAEVVGYLDADLSTPPAQIDDLHAALGRPGVQVATGARVGMLGYDIERSAVRHYLGRVFASAASIILQARIYDTQCGAKLMRRSAALLEALDEPFTSRWVFDVDLIGRLLATQARRGPISIIEEPLLAWRDIPGSKVRPAHFFTAATDLARIGWSLRSRRRGD